MNTLIINPCNLRAGLLPDQLAAPLDRRAPAPDFAPLPGSLVRPRLGAPVMELSADELPAVCPNSSMPLWAAHPRVFLEVVNESEAMCPYCGTRYRLVRGADVLDHQYGKRALHQHREGHLSQAAAQPKASMPCRVRRREATNVRADIRGNTTLELMTQWLKGQR